MTVGATHTEGGDPGQRTLLRPWFSGELRLHAPSLEVDLGVGVCEVQCGDQLSVGQAQDCFEQANDTGGTFQMAKVGLDRSHPQRFAPVLPEELTKRGCLDRITGRCAGAVQFDVSDSGRVCARALISLVQHPDLSLDIWTGQEGGSSGIVDRSRSQHSMDPISIGQGTVEELEHHDGAAFPTHIAVGTRVEGVAARVRGETTKTMHTVGALTHQDQIDPSGKSSVGLSSAKALGGHMHTHQRGGLPRVHRQARPGQAQHVGHPVGNHAALCAGEGVVSQSRATHFLS